MPTLTSKPPSFKAAAEEEERLIHENMLEKARGGNLLAYTSLTKPDYEINWHHKIMGKKLTQFVRGEIPRLMIYAPPRHGKSELTSRRLPALIHGLYPTDHIIAVSYNGDLATSMNIDAQRIIDTPEHLEIFPNTRIQPEGTKGGYARNASGYELLPIDGKLPGGKYQCAGVNGTVTGKGGHWLLVDDPIKNREDADSPTYRRKLDEFYTSTLRTRLEGNAKILITQTRWHADDLAGRLLALANSDPKADQWEVLSIPAVKEDFEPEHDGMDTRLPGEGLWLNKYDQAWYESTQASLGSRDWAALYQQQPVTEGGNIIKSEWFKFYGSLPDRFDQVIQSWDFAVKDKQTSDFTVGMVWGRKGTDKFLLDVVRGRFSFPNACQALVDLSRKWPRAEKKLIEAKANGPAIIQTLHQQVPGLVEVEPRGDKTARLYAVSTQFEAGHVWVPDPKFQPWSSVFMDEVCSFPSAKHDDQVDAATQALDLLGRTNTMVAPIAGHGSGKVWR